MDNKNIILKGLSNLKNEMNNASGGLFERLENVEIENGNLQQKNKKLEQALDDIEKICNNISREDSICDIGKIHDIEVIIKKANL
jgi:hypothetical protein